MILTTSKVGINPKVAKKILTIFIGEDFSLYLFNNSLTYLAAQKFPVRAACTC